MSEFSDRPFVAGSLTGVRSFKVDHLGRLTGVSFRTAWTPAENVATCLNREDGGLFASYTASFIQQMYLAPLRFQLGADSTITAAPADPAQEARIKEAKALEAKHHRPGGLSCQCGFYAYYDYEPNQYHDSGQMHGVIEGYGTAVVGSRGFRCEKAVIKALVIKPKNEQRHARTRALYPDLPVFTSRLEALDAFPLTPPPMPTPESDPEFWTRES